MPKPAAAVNNLPAPARESLEILGSHLRLGRTRRGESMRTWALRMNVSVPTLAAMERGDPKVSMGVYATALWLLGLDQGLRDLAAHSHDPQTLVQGVSAIPRTMGNAKKREAELFDFLANQAKKPDEALLIALAMDDAARDNLGFMLLLTAITVEDRVSRKTVTQLNRIAAKLLGPQLNNEEYGRWLRSGAVDVERLNSHIEKAFA